MVYIECRTDPRYCSLLVRLRFWDNLQGSRHSSHLVSSFFMFYYLFYLYYFCPRYLFAEKRLPIIRVIIY